MTWRSANAAPAVANPQKIFGEGDMREVALEVHLVFLTIGGLVQEPVVVVEDVPFGDGVVAVVGSEFGQCPIGDVLLSVRVVFVVSVEGEGFVVDRHRDSHQEYIGSSTQQTLSDRSLRRKITRFSNSDTDVGKIEGNTCTSLFIVRSK